MKAFFAFFCLAPLLTLAQDINWFEPGSSWTYNYQTIDGPEQFQSNFIIDGTTFADQACVIMETAGDYPFLCSPFPTPFYFYESNDSVFFATEIDSTFRLAYNFTADVGDSWPFIIPLSIDGSVETYNVEVVALSTINFDGTDVKKMLLNYQNISENPVLEIYPEEMSIIQYLGATHELFAPFGKYTFCDALSTVQIQCFNSPSLNYTNPEFGNCILSVPQASEQRVLKFYPNPARDYITITTDLTGNSMLKITQLDGKIVYYRPIDSGTEKVGIADLSVGMYIIEVSTANERSFGKLLIQ